MTSMPPATRYVLERQLGAGGYCEVWRAADTVLGRPVAVKLLHPGYAQQPEALARFKAEALHAGALSQENIARVYDYSEPDGGRPYLVMEVIDGPTLTEVLAGGPIDAARTMDIVAQVAAGLQAAHAIGLIHRDITPANILFAADGTVKITDFGIAHAVGSVPLTATGTVLGTPGYIAPERVRGHQSGPASDLYALGIVAYECLAGARPFAGPPLEVAIAHRDRPLPPLPAWVPAEVAGLVMMLTAKDPAWRPATAGEVADRAARLREELTTGSRPAPAITGPPPTVAQYELRPAQPAVPTHPGRWRTLVAAGGLAAITGLVALSVLGFTSGSQSSGSQSPGSQSPVAYPATAYPATGRSPVSHPAASPSSATRPSGPAASSESPLATQPAGARPQRGPSHPAGSGPAADGTLSQPGPHQHKAGHGNGEGSGKGRAKGKG